MKFYDRKRSLLSIRWIVFGKGPGAVMHGDVHNGAQGYLIRPPYFDTPDDQGFSRQGGRPGIAQENPAAQLQPSGDFAMLEMKQKEGPYQRKRSLLSLPEDARSSQGTTRPRRNTKIPLRRNAID